jgi:ClpP class serine protease
VTEGARPNLMAEVERELETEPDLIVVLERNRGWMSLVSRIEGRRAAKERILMAKIFTRGEAIDQREVDYLHGYFDALDWMTGLPERVRKKLKEEEGA